MATEKTDYQKKEDGFLWFKVWKNKISLSADYFIYLLFGGFIISILLTVALYNLFPKIYFEHSPYKNYSIVFKTSEERLFLTSDNRLISVDEANKEYDGNLYESKDKQEEKSPLMVYEDDEGNIAGALGDTKAWSEFFLNEILDGIIRIVFVFFTLLFAATAGLYAISIKKITKKAEDTNKDKHLAGTRIQTIEELTSLQEKLNIKGIEISKGVLLDETQITKHMFLAGASGVGKSVLLKRMYVQFVHLKLNLKIADSKFIVHDTKGDWISQFYNPKTDFILNPLDTRSINFNVFSLLRSKADIKALASALISESKDTEPIWRNSSRDLLEAIIYYCIQEGMTNNESIKYLINLQIGNLAKLLKGVTGGENGYGHIASYANSSQPANIFSNFKVNMNFFLNMEATETEAFDLREWLRSGTGTIFLANFADIQDMVSPILSLFIDTAARELLAMGEDDSRRVYFMLDEFGSLKKMEGVIKLLTLARSFGGAVFIGIQEKGNIERTYGKELIQTILNNCSTKIFMLADEPETQDFISRAIGEEDIEFTTTSNSLGAEEKKDGSSISKNRKTQKAVMASVIGQLEEHHFYFKQRKVGWTKVEGAYIIESDKRPNICEKFIENNSFLIDYKSVKTLKDATEEVQAVEQAQIAIQSTPAEPKKSGLARNAILGASSVAVVEIVENTVEEFKEIEDDEDNFSSGFAEESEV